MGAQFRGAPRDQDSRTLLGRDDRDSDGGRLAVAELMRLSIEAGDSGG